MAIKGTIFDADGTLLDSMGVWSRLGEIYLDSLKIKSEPELSAILFPMSLEEGSLYLKEHYVPDMSREEIQSGILDIICDFYKYEVKTKKGVPEFLENLRLKGIPAVIATAGDTSLLRAALERLGILCCFNGIYSCGELDTTKKSSYIYEFAARSMGTAASETVVFEDSLTAIKSAKSGGFYVVAVEDEESISERCEIKKTADNYIKDFFDLTDFLSADENQPLK